MPATTATRFSLVAKSSSPRLLWAHDLGVIRKPEMTTLRMTNCT